MKNIANKTAKKRGSPLLLQALAVGIVALLVQNAQSQGIVYNNSTTFNGNFNFAAGTQAGNEVVLAGSATSDTITQFQVQFDLTGAGAPNGGDGVEVQFYANTGATVNGYASPGTLLYSSGFSSLTSFTSGSTLTYSIPNVVVPKDFTWTLVFEGVPAGEAAGLGLFGPATVGGNYHDAWVNNGSAWVLDVATGTGTPALEFGATLTAVPEPSTIALGVIGACAFLARRRKS